MIYTRLQEDYTWFTQEHSPAQDTYPLFIGEEETPKTASGLVQNHLWPDCQLTGRLTDSTARSTARSTTQSPVRLQNLLKISVDQPDDWPNWVPLPRATSVDLSGAVDWHAQELKSVDPILWHRVKKLYPPCFALSFSLHDDALSPVHMIIQLKNIQSPNPILFFTFFSEYHFLYFFAQSSFFAAYKHKKIITVRHN